MLKEDHQQYDPRRMLDRGCRVASSRRHMWQLLGQVEPTSVGSWRQGVGQYFTLMFYMLVLL